MQKNVKKLLASVWLAASVLSALFFLCAIYLNSALPDKFYAGSLATFELNAKIPVTCEPTESVSAADTVLVDNTYEARLKIMGILPVKTVSVEVAKDRDVVVLGEPFGIKFFTKGVLVTDIQAVDTKNGSVNPAKEAGITVGDIISQIDGVQVEDSNHAAKLFKESGGRALNLTVCRGEEEMNLTLAPAFSHSENCYKAGLWIKDSMAGIGTLTFYSPHYNVVAGLGHAVADTPSQTALPLAKGEMVPADIISVSKSCNGAPGELRGRFANGTIGNILSNNETGVYAKPQRGFVGRNMPMAFKQEIHTGEAYIITTVGSGGPAAYKCKISKINYDPNERTRNMLITVTDPELLKKTGGIVQGMSGSPVVQDGKLVGAVTHVLVNDTTCGYAIFAENMLETAQSIGREQLKDAS